MPRDNARQPQSGHGAALAPGGTRPGGMAVLGLIEFALSFAVIYTMIQIPGAVSGLPAFVPVVVATPPRGPLELAAVIAATLAAIGISIGLYRADVMLHRTRLVAAVAISTAAAFTVLILLAGSLGRGITMHEAASIARVIGAWVVVVVSLRLSIGLALRHRRPDRRVLLLGDPTRVEQLLARMQSRLGRRFDAVITHARNVADDLDWSALSRQDLWAVIMAPGVGADAMDALLDCKMRGQRVISSADFQERSLRRIDLDSLTCEGLLAADGFAATRMSDRIKRASDIVIAAAMLLLTLPLMMITALLIKADSPGPILYRQDRIGVFGKPFTVFKFRSMTVDAEAGGSPRWAQKGDPRVTRVGRFIRATRIDELPQLANIIRGEMSLVGPRPERPLFVDQLTRAIPFYTHRSYVKPGLTGWAQVNYPYGASIEDAREKLAYDLYYVKHRSFWFDARILLATVRVVLLQEGAR